MFDVVFKAKRIDNDSLVEGYYFKTPLTNENSGLDSKFGWFFLSDGEVRHCIATTNGNVYVIDPKTIEVSLKVSYK
jgi:hypothetical protein